MYLRVSLVNLEDIQRAVNKLLVSHKVHCNAAFTIEGRGLRWVMKIVKQEGFRCVTIECDSKINYRCLEKYRCDMKEIAT